MVTLCLVIVASSLVGVVCPEVVNMVQREQIKRMASYIKNCGQIPGLSMSIVRGSESWSLSLRLSDVTSREPVTDTTNFAIGSLTKAFTSTLLVTLLKESPNNYTLDTPLKDILGDSHIFTDEIRSQQASVKDLLSHRMGLMRADLAIFGGFPEDYTLADMASAISCLPAQRPFRDRYIYSNFMYSLAGHVIEKLSNQSYSEVIKSRLLGPLHMTSTMTQYNVSDPYDGMAQPYLYLDGQLSPAHHSVFRLKPFLPAFGLASNARDMTKWIQLQLGRGVTPSGERVVPEGVIDMTHQPITPNIINNLRPRFPQPDLTFAYGLGWHQAVYKGFRRVWHAGTLFGYTSLIWMFPDLNFGLFLAINGPSKAPDTKNRISALFYYITDLLLGDQPWIDQSTACFYPYPSPRIRRSAVQNTVVKRSMTYKNTTETPIGCDIWSETVEKYTGRFYNRLFGNVTVSLGQGEVKESICKNVYPKLQIQFGQRFAGDLILVSGSPHQFQMKPTGIFEFSAHPSDQ